MDRLLSIRNTRNGATLGNRVAVADRHPSRMKGPLGTSRLGAGEGLLIEPCRSVHTFFMSYPIDVLFLDHENRVVGSVPDMPPWRLTSYHRRASRVLELPPGTVRETGTETGDLLEMEEVAP